MEVSEQIKDLHEEILFPSVRVETEEAGGSGTIIYSRKMPEEKDKEGFESYVLTNWHVIEDAINIKEEWDPVKEEEIKEEYRDTVQVEIFDYEYLSENIGGMTLEADIMCWDKREDLALLRLRTIQEFDEVAELYPKGKEKEIKLFQNVHCVGCSLGHSPIVTQGQITSKVDEIDNKIYWMTNAQSIFGNSGGSVFLPDGRMIGIPARISAMQLGFGVDIITHMGFFIPIQRIYDFLESQIFDFIFKEDKTSEDCREEREKRKEEEKEKRGHKGKWVT